MEHFRDVALGWAGAGDGPVRHLEGGFLAPGGEIVTAGQLFALPRPQRLERMRRDYERNSVILFSKNAAEMTVPSVAMHEVGIDVRRVEVETALDCAENRLERFWTSEVAGVELVTFD